VSKPLTVGSLFAGIGGLELGLERAGMEVKWQVEIDDYATKVLEKHWPRVARWRDITTFPPDAISEQDNIQHKEPRRPGKQRRHSVDTRTKAARQANGKASTDRTIRRGEGWSVDVICGGFPCQDISYTGKGAGLDGERSGLFYEAIRVVGLIKPRFVLLENVAALLNRGLSDVLGTLASIGYSAEWHCLQAADVGAPHIRDRIFIVAVSDPDGSRQPQPQGHIKKSGRRVGDVDEAVADTRGQRLPKRQGCKAPRTLPAVTRGTWWDAEPALDRVAYGVPRRVDRLRCLGNAVVPRVAEVFGRYIVELNERT